jgi:hypothetical protein
MDLSPQLIRAPSSPMASPIRGPPAEAAAAAAAAADAGPVEEIPGTPRSPPTAAFDQGQFEEDKRREEADTDSDVDDVKKNAARDQEMALAAKAQIDAAHAAEFNDPDNVINRISASPMPMLDLNAPAPIAPSIGAAAPAAAAAPSAPSAAAASESKSGGGGGGGGSGGDGKWSIVSTNKLIEELKLIDAWVKDPSFLFGSVPYTGDEKKRKDVEDILTQWIQTALQATRDEPDSKQSVWDLFEENLYAEFRDPEGDWGDLYDDMDDALSYDLIRYIHAYMKLSGIDVNRLSFDELHSFFMDVVHVEIALEPIAAKRNVEAAELKKDSNPRKAKRRKVKSRQSAADGSDSDAADDERSSVASGKDIGDDE